MPAGFYGILPFSTGFLRFCISLLNTVPNRNAFGKTSTETRQVEPKHDEFVGFGVPAGSRIQTPNKFSSLVGSYSMLSNGFPLAVHQRFHHAIPTRPQHPAPSQPSVTVRPNRFLGHPLELPAVPFAQGPQPGFVPVLARRETSRDRLRGPRFTIGIQGWPMEPFWALICRCVFSCL